MEKILLHVCCGPCAIAPIIALRKSNFIPSAYFFNPNIHLQREFLLRLNAMQEVSLAYKTELIIEGNHNYLKEISKKNLCEENKAILYKKALKSNVTEFEQLSNEKWKIAIKKILDKWVKYQDEFNQYPNSPELEVNPLDWFLNLNNYNHGERCKQCYEERLLQTALYAAQNSYKKFTSSLLYSRYQNHEHICQAAKNATKKVNSMLEEKAITGDYIEFYYQDYRQFWQDGIDASKDMGIYRQKYCGCILSRFESLVQMAGRKVH